MKKLFILSGVLLAASLLSGCGEETKSADWWQEHPEEATAKYQECKKSGEESVNCQNIKQVKVKIAYKYAPMMKIIEDEAEAVKRGMQEK